MAQGLENADWSAMALIALRSAGIQSGT